MEVMMGFLGAAYVRDIGVGEVQDNVRGVTAAPLSRQMIFQNEDRFREEDQDEDELDRSSSSIGVPDDSEDEEEDEEEVSSAGFGSMGLLEDSLPIKRGLSDHFAGKSKSFTNLAEVTAMTTTKGIEKTEHPFNKKRRILRWSKKNSTTLPTAVSMPLFPVPDVDEDDEPHLGARDDHGNDEDHLPTARSVFKSYSCVALTDLREEDEHEEEENDD